MPKLERYIKQATRGLYGKKRAQVARELRGNLLARAAELRSFGASEPEALERALHEFGAAQTVSRGFYEVYTMPSINKIAALVGLLGLTAYLSLSATATGLNYTLEAPQPVCKMDAKGKYDAQPCVSEGSSWLELDSLVQTFQQGGVDARLRISAGASRATPVRASEPSEVIELLLPGQAPVKLEFLKANGNDSTGYGLGTFTKGKQRFVSTESLFRAFGLAAVPLRVSSLTNPKVEVQGVALSLGSPKQPVQLNAALEGYIIARIFAQYSVVSTDAQGKPLKIPEMEGPFGGFAGGVGTLSSQLWGGNFQPPTRKLSVSEVAGRFFLLVSKPRTVGAGNQPVAVPQMLLIELLERLPGDVLVSRSLPVVPAFVVSNAKLRSGSLDSVWLLPVNFEKPYELLDVKNPAMLPLSAVSEGH